MNANELKQRINNVIDDWASQQPKVTFSSGGAPEPAEAEIIETKRELPEGKRVVRTKTQGDRVFLLDEEKKTRHWVTSPEALANQGFDMGDVGEVEDTVLRGYQMAAPLYR